MKKIESESMSEYVIKIRELTDSLAATGDIVEDRDKIEFVADGLGPKFWSFNSSIHSQPHMLFEEFIHLIIREDAFLHRQTLPSLAPSSSDVGSSSLAFVAKVKHSSIHRDYRSKNEQRGKSSKNRWRKSSSSNVVCQLCDIVGHSTKTCRRVTKAMATMEDCCKDGTWLLDSKASSNMTPNLDNLSKAQEYSGINCITIGNGLGLLLTHISIAKIDTNSSLIRLRNTLCVPHLKMNLILVQAMSKYLIVILF